MKGWAIAALCAALLLLSVLFPRQREGGGDVARQHTIDSLKNRVAQLTVAAEKVDTVWRARKARVDTIRETLNIHDTTEVIRYVAATDSALKSCSELADTCAAQREAADKFASMLQGEVAILRKRLDRQSFTSRFGLSVGYGVMKVGEDVKAGPIVGVTVRVFP